MRTLPTSFYADQQDHTPLKTSLFTQVHELEGLSVQLEKVAKFSTKEKKNWLDDNETLIKDLVERLTQQTPLDLEQMEVDGEMLTLVSEYTGKMQSVMTLIQHIMEVNTSKIKG